MNANPRGNVLGHPEKNRGGQDKGQVVTEGTDLCSAAAPVLLPLYLGLPALES